MTEEVVPKKEVESSAPDTGSEPTDMERKVIQQVEYYFGDINLRRDKFLKEEITKDEGWVSLSTLLNFNRLKALSEDKAFIIAALQKSTSNILDIEASNIEEAKVRRSKEKPVAEWSEDVKKDFNERTVHLKGFPLDATLDQITEFAAQYGKVEAVEMRKMKETKQFKGCAMVTYFTKSDADSVLASDKKFSDDLPMLRENKATYFERKSEFHKKRLEKRKEGKNKSKSKDGEEAMDEKEEGDGANGQGKGEKRKKEGEDGDGEGDGDEDDEGEKEEESVVESEGAVIKLLNIPGDIKFFHIKELFKKHGEIQFVDIVEETREGFVRLKGVGSAKAALDLAKSGAKTEGKASEVKAEEKEAEVEVKKEKEEGGGDNKPIEKEGDDKEKENAVESEVKTENGAGDAAEGTHVLINGHSIQATILDGAEEVTYWKKVKEIRGNFKGRNEKSKRGGGRRGGRGRGRGGYRGGRKRAGDGGGFGSRGGKRSRD